MILHYNCSIKAVRLNKFNRAALFLIYAASKQRTGNSFAGRFWLLL